MTYITSMNQLSARYFMSLVTHQASDMACVTLAAQGHDTHTWPVTPVLIPMGSPLLGLVRNPPTAPVLGADSELPKGFLRGTPSLQLGRLVGSTPFSHHTGPAGGALLFHMSQR